METKRLCTFPGCDREHWAKGLCATHNRQQWLGNPLRTIKAQRPRGSPPVILYDEAPCPVEGLEGPVGPIPRKKMVDHRCRVRACCNPHHLRVVTAKVNATENSIGFAAVNKAKTHCLKGHCFDKKNTYRTRDGRRRARPPQSGRRSLRQKSRLGTPNEDCRQGLRAMRLASLR